MYMGSEDEVFMELVQNFADFGTIQPSVLRQYSALTYVTRG